MYLDVPKLGMVYSAICIVPGLHSYYELHVFSVNKVPMRIRNVGLTLSSAQ
jgi:hypothetical protein